MTISAADPRYPIGPFSFVVPSDAVRRAAMEDIAALPARMRAAVAGLKETQLDTPYRDGGWTVRQVVHHVADSHMNGFTRTKLALTEERPTVKPYDEKAFAQLPDMELPVSVSLGIIDGVHARWAAILHRLTTDQFGRAFLHPEYTEPQTLDRQLQHYAWHCRHHVAHITELRRRNKERQGVPADEGW